MRIRYEKPTPSGDPGTVTRRRIMYLYVVYFEDIVYHQISVHNILLYGGGLSAFIAFT